MRRVAPVLFAALQTPDGYLWFGTFGGLVRFDGVNFTVFNRANTPQLPSAGIVNLHLDQRGWLWVSTTEGMVVLADSKWHAFATNEVGRRLCAHVRRTPQRRPAAHYFQRKSAGICQ